MDRRGIEVGGELRLSRSVLCKCGIAASNPRRPGFTTAAHAVAIELVHLVGHLERWVVPAECRTNQLDLVGSER